MVSTGYRTAVIVVIISLALSACARKIEFQRSSVVPAAEGTIKIKKDKNGNYGVAVKVLHLAPPEKLDPPKKIYVVWMETREHGQKNIGQIAVSGGLFSSTLKGTLKTVTSFEPKRFYITAEEDADRTYPGMQVVLESGKLSD